MFFLTILFGSEMLNAITSLVSYKNPYYVSHFSNMCLPISSLRMGFAIMGFNTAANSPRESFTLCVQRAMLTMLFRSH